MKTPDLEWATQRSLASLVEWGEYHPGPTLSLGLALTLVLGIIDYLTGIELAFAIFYLLAIIPVTWVAGRDHGLVVAIACTVAWVLANLFQGRDYSNLLVPYWNLGVWMLAFILVALLLGGLRDAHMRVRVLARTDPLTGLVNRRHFRELAELELARALRSGESISVAFLDLDRLKTVNDRMGHQIGDTVLVTIARTIRSSVRAIDQVGRVGGDEFAVILVNTSAAQAQEIFTRLVRDVDTVARARGWPISLSIGVASFLHPPESVDLALNRADELMYQAKQAGGKQTCFTTVEMKEPVWTGMRRREPGAPVELGGRGSRFQRVDEG